MPVTRGLFPAGEDVLCAGSGEWTARARGPWCGDLISPPLSPPSIQLRRLEGAMGQSLNSPGNVLEWRRPAFRLCPRQVGLSASVFLVKLERMTVKSDLKQQWQ